MMAPTPTADRPDPVCSLLVIIPGSVNFFYNSYARWMAADFERLGARVTLCELPEVPPGTFDLCILSNGAEVLHANEANDGRRRLEDVRKSVKTLINFSAECVHTRWFLGNLHVSREVGADAILDVGFLDQRAGVPPGLDYHFAFDGLRDDPAPAPDGDPDARTIPWVHVGMHTPGRIELTERLIADVSPHGLFFLPDMAPVKEKGSHHLNQDHMSRILTRAKYYIWCSHHGHFFMESLRFRAGWETGCLPIKVVDDETCLPPDCPFSAWVVRESELVEWLRDLPFAAERRAFEAEYRRRPRLEEGLARMLARYGYLDPADTGAGATADVGSEPTGEPWCIETA